MNTRASYLFLLTVSFLSGIWPALGNPAGEVVKAGNVTFNRPSASVLNVNQTSDRAIIHWDRFSIGNGELTRFNLPSSTSATLNRVLSGSPSEIYGTLQSNGRIYLINPSGILVGAGGQVNTRAFIGSTLDTADRSFLAGAGMKFSGSSTASVENRGNIQAIGGDVFLFARTVENSGHIQASEGTVGLAAGSEVLLQQAGADERIAVRAGNRQGGTAANGVNNVGAIEAAAAELKAAGGNIYALAINNGGVVRANGIVNQGGRIMLKAMGGNIQNSGTLSARKANGAGGTIEMNGGRNAANPSTVVSTGTIDARGDASGKVGGQVRVLGNRVGLLGDGRVDVSGDAGGGTALIGGDYQGKNRAIQNAERTLVSRGTSIKADAISSGDGGKVIVWSDAWTRFFGDISAKGGEQSGNGGMTEVSGKQSLLFDGTVQLGASHGKGGTLLLDPKTVTIQDVNPDINGDGTPADDYASVNDLDKTSDQNNKDSIITAGALAAVMNSGGGKSVTIAAENKIEVKAAIDATANSGEGLTLEAPSIVLNVAGTTAAPSIKTSGDQVFDGAVTLGQNTVLESTGGKVEFKNTVDSFSSTKMSLEINTAQDTIFGGVVGGVNSLAGLTTDGTLASAGSKGGRTLFNMTAPATGTKGAVNAESLLLNDTLVLNVGGSSAANPSVLTSLGQSYQAVILDRDAVLRDSGGSSITFNSTVDSASGENHSLNIGTGGTTSFKGIVGASDVLSGLTTASGGSTLIDIASAAGLAAGKGYVNAQGVTFGNALKINTPGALDSHPSIATTDNQTYNGAVTLSGPTVLTTGGTAKNIIFGSTVDSDSVTPGSLELHTSGFAQFSGNVGGANRLSSLTVFNQVGFGDTANAISIKTSGDQLYSSLATLRNNSTLDSSGGNITFNQLIEGGFGLTTTTTASGKATEFKAQIGDITPLASLTVNGNVTFNIILSDASKPSIQTSGAQTYNGAVTLSRSAVLKSTTAGDIIFGSTVQGLAKDLEVNTAGTTRFSQQLGLSGSLLNLIKTDAAGLTELCNGAFVLTLTVPDLSTIGGTLESASALVFNNAMKLCSDTIIRAPSVTFNDTLDGIAAGGQGLTIEKPLLAVTGGDAIFTKAVGQNFSLKYLSIADGLATISGGTVITSGDQSYNKVSLGANTTLTGQNFGLTGNLVGNEHNLRLNFAGNTTIQGSRFVGVHDLASGNGGVTLLKGSVTTSGSQTYDDDVQITAGVNLDTTGPASAGPGAAITFNGTVTESAPGDILDITAGAGVVSFNKAVGGAAGLGALTVNSAGGITIADQIKIDSTTLLEPAVTLHSSGGVTETANGKIISPNLLLRGSGTFSLNGNNAVSKVAADVTGSVSFRDSIGLTLGQVGATPEFNSHNNNITIAADSLDITVALKSGTGRTTLQPFTAGRDIELGDGTSSAHLNISQAELNNITAGTLEISQAGNIDITGDLALAPGTLVLQGAGNIGGPGSLTVDNLAVSSQGDVSLKNLNKVNVLSAMLSGSAGHSFFFRNTPGLIIGAVDGLDGITAVNGLANLDLVTGGTLTLNNDVNAGNAASLAFDHLGALTGPGKVTAGTLTLLGNADVGASGAELNTKVGSIRMAKTGGTSFIKEEDQVTIQDQDATHNAGAALAFTAGDTTVGANGLSAGSLKLNTFALTLNGGLTAGAGLGTVQINNQGSLIGLGPVLGDTLILGQNGNVGSFGGPLQVKVNTLVLNKTGGNAVVDNGAGAISVHGTTPGDLDLTAGNTTVDSTLAVKNAALNTAALNLASDVNASGDVTLNNSGVASGAGTLSANTLNLKNGGQVTLNTAVGTLALAKSGGDTLVNNGAGAISVHGTTPGDLDLTAGNTTVDSTLTVKNAALNTAALNLASDVNASGDVTLNNSDSITGGGTVSGTSLKLTGIGNVGFDGGALNAAVNSIVLDKQGPNATFIRTPGDVSIGGTTEGNLQLTAAGNISQNAALTIGKAGAEADATFIANGNGNIILDNPNNDFFGRVFFRATPIPNPQPGFPSINILRNVTVFNKGDFILQKLAISGNLEVHSANGSITEADTVSAGTFSASAANDIILGKLDKPGLVDKTQPANQFDFLGKIQAGRLVYIYDSNGGLKVAETVQGRTVVLRTVGDLDLLDKDASHLGGRIVAGSGTPDNGLPVNIILSAEGGSQPRFLNSAAFKTLPTLSPNSSFFIFSFTPNLNGDRGGTIPGTSQLRFGDITAVYQKNSSSYDKPGNLAQSRVFSFQDSDAKVAQAASELAKAFIEIRQTKEAARFRVDPKSKRPAAPPNMVYMSSYDLMHAEGLNAAKMAAK